MVNKMVISSFSSSSYLHQYPATRSSSHKCVSNACQHISRWCTNEQV